MVEAGIILGNQLFDFKYYKNFPDLLFMAEDRELCTHYKYHKHKIIHFLSSMRKYRDLLLDKGKRVEYYDLNQSLSYLDKLSDYMAKNNISKLIFYEIEDKFFEKKIIEFLESRKIEFIVYKNPMFLVSRKEFKDYLSRVKKPFLNSFYIELRKKYEILLDQEEPIGGSWNFDSQNRKKIPKKFDVTSFIPDKIDDDITNEVKNLVSTMFSEHPGEVDSYWIPNDRKTSIKYFKEYMKNRFAHFGTYQDALDNRNPFLYHSLISPALNIGFVTPLEIIQYVQSQLKDDHENINSVEGFIRQVLGWREFVRGIYQNFDHIQQEKNFFNHQRKLTHHWYDGTTGIPPLDDAIKKADKWGYCHHIERLMVIGNMMLLLEVHPQEVYKWFMEMFVDSSDWVMGPNVFGMSQFSDGGIFATKPYISGSNYLLKMGHYKKDKWCDAIDGLYWGFISDKSDFLKKNHRMSMMVSSLNKMDAEKKTRIFSAAQELKNRITYEEN